MIYVLCQGPINWVALLGNPERFGKKNLLRTGFCTALLFTLKLRPDAVLHMGPPCSSFVFLNQGTARRSADRPFGNEDRKYVEQGSMKLRLKFQKVLNQSGLHWKYF